MIKVEPLGAPLYGYPTGDFDLPQMIPKATYTRVSKTVLSRNRKDNQLLLSIYQQALTSKQVNGQLQVFDLGAQESPLAFLSATYRRISS